MLTYVGKYATGTVEIDRKHKIPTWLQYTVLTILYSWIKSVA
jgi:hypothetical protein